MCIPLMDIQSTKKEHDIGCSEETKKLKKDHAFLVDIKL